jgi:hypothetical protein
MGVERDYGNEGGRARMPRSAAHPERRESLRRILACVLATAGVAAGSAGAAGPPRRAALPPAVDLAADGAASTRARLPILLFFDRVDCPYCKRALREYLVPMTEDAAWRDRALYRQVEVDGTAQVIAFGGARTTHRALAARYGVTLTPTIVVVDAAGNALEEPVVGFTTPDFYGAYVERAVDAATKKLRGEA